jgi:hypothetical protein
MVVVVVVKGNDISINNKKKVPLSFRVLLGAAFQGLTSGFTLTTYYVTMLKKV